MKFWSSFSAIISLVAAKTILLSNDDSFVSSEIRALYRELKNASYDVIMVAPANQRSSYGGAFIVPSGEHLSEDGEFGYVKAGDASFGQDPEDDDIWYFGGTPSACISFAFDYLLDKEYPDTKIDLVVSGVNQGPNISPGYYTSSGTVSAAYMAVYRAYPAIAFGGSNLNNTFFKDAPNDEYDPSNIYATKAVEIIDKLLDGDNFLPGLTGINVNFPEVGYLLDDETTCTDPAWKFSALLSGGAVFGPSILYDENSKTFTAGFKQYENLKPSCDGINCDLPDEYSVFWARDCTTSVSVFYSDYSAKGSVADDIRTKLGLFMVETH